MLDLLGTVFTSVVSAQADAGGADSVAVSSVWDFLVKGGVMMVPIGACSLIVVAVAAERSLVLRRHRAAPPGLADSVHKSLSKGRVGKADALKKAKDSDSPLGRVLTEGIRQFGRPVDVVERHMSSAGSHEVFDLRKRLRVLSVITAAAPLLGLVGTIMGMITAFQTVALSADALGKTELLAKGIYEAMITTAAGLLVAIPSLVIYHWLIGRIEGITRDMDRACVRVIDLIAASDAGPGRLNGHGRGLSGAFDDPTSDAALPSEQGAVDAGGVN